MPEYLAPGVYVEETSFRSKSIEGVSTTTTGFVGPTRFGPVKGVPGVVTSLADFERVYGDGLPLTFGGESHTNYMWQAARVFFEQGGKRLYVSRVYADGGDSTASGAIGTDEISLKARHPGALGSLRYAIALSAGQPVRKPPPGGNPPGLRAGDVVVAAPAEGEAAALHTLKLDAGEWKLTPVAGGADTALADAENVRPVLASVDLQTPEGAPAWPPVGGLVLNTDPDDDRQTLLTAFPEDLPPGSEAPPLLVAPKDGAGGADIVKAFSDEIRAELVKEDPDAEKATLRDALTKGGDGTAPGSGEYSGEIDEDDLRSGLMALEDIEEISIVAAPGAYENYDTAPDDPDGIIQALAGHAERMRYRIAVIDPGKGQTITQVQGLKSKLDSSHAALYYPWVRVMDPVTRAPVLLPPSGFVAGIYARNDVNRAVYKAPANEVVTGAIGFERTVNRAQQEVLNPLGVNCLRFFEGRGYRVWGARTASSDPEWKYVNVRRYFAYLERSVDRGTQWAVFEPNGDALWANVRRTISDFLLNEWQNGALLGTRPEEAYFVKCDRSTMSQNDLDNGRLVCLVGVAALRPAEFVIFRIGQWTADRRR